MTEHTVQVNGIALHLAEAGPGSGPPVVLLHGFPDSWKLWRHQVAALAGAGHRVLAPDLRGFGESTRPAAVDAYRLRTVVADVTGLLELLGVERAAVVGHDWGAAVAWRVAMFAPERVERLVAVSVGHPLAGVAAGLPQRRLSWYVLWFLFPGVAERVLPPTTGPCTAAGSGPTPSPARTPTSTASSPTCRAPARWRLASTGTGPTTTRRFPADDPTRFDLPSVACPSLGVWSSDDPTLSEAQMTGSADYVTGPWRYERFDGVDHWVPVHAPDRLNRLLLEFLGGQPDPGVGVC